MQSQSLMFGMHSCLFDVSFLEEIRKISVLNKPCNFYTNHYKIIQCKADLSDISYSVPDTQNPDSLFST